jgi:hypothetical protein
MGNPPILNRDRDRDRNRAQRVASQGAPAAPELQWEVFVMRDKGQRIPRDQLRARIGALTIDTTYEGTPCARVIDEWGNDLGRLEDVRVRRMLPTGALLLRGVESVGHSKWGVREFPCAWWCRPRLLRRAKFLSGCDLSAARATKYDRAWNEHDPNAEVQEAPSGCGRRCM